MTKAARSSSTAAGWRSTSSPTRSPAPARRRLRCARSTPPARPPAPCRRPSTARCCPDPRNARCSMRWPTCRDTPASRPRARRSQPHEQRLRAAGPRPSAAAPRHRAADGSPISRRRLKNASRADQRGHPQRDRPVGDDRGQHQRGRTHPEQQQHPEQPPFDGDQPRGDRQRVGQHAHQIGHRHRPERRRRAVGEQARVQRDDRRTASRRPLPAGASRARGSARSASDTPPLSAVSATYMRPRKRYAPRGAAARPRGQRERARDRRQRRRGGQQREQRIARARQQPATSACRSAPSRRR